MELLFKLSLRLYNPPAIPSRSIEVAAGVRKKNLRILDESTISARLKRQTLSSTYVVKGRLYPLFVFLHAARWRIT